MNIEQQKICYASSRALKFKELLNVSESSKTGTDQNSNISLLLHEYLNNNQLQNLLLEYKWGEVPYWRTYFFGKGKFG